MDLFTLSNVSKLYDIMENTRYSLKKKNKDYKLSWFSEFIQIVITYELNKNKINIKEIDKKMLLDFFIKITKDMYKEDNDIYKSINNFEVDELYNLYSLNKYFNISIDANNIDEVIEIFDPKDNIDYDTSKYLNLIKKSIIKNMK